MNKKSLKLSVTSVIAFLVFGLASCGGDSHVHTYEEGWHYDATYHWHAATCGHNVVDGKAEHTFKDTVVSPTYEERGYTLHECTICDYEFKDTFVDKLEHHYATQWSHDDYTHWHACTDTGYENIKGDNAPHTFGAWIIDDPAYEGHDGTRHRTCSTCNHTVSETYKYVAGSHAERLYVSSTANELFNGYTYTINPVLVPYDAIDNVKYEVEHPEKLTVTGNTALATATGDTLVYLYNDEDNDGVRDSDEAFTVMSFSITDADPEKYITVQESVTIEVGESKKLDYSNTGISSSGLDYGFYSEDQSICTISEGKVKGHKAGTTRVSVSCQGYRAYCNVIVENKVDELGLRASEITSEDDFVMNKGESKTISYTILPADSYDTLASVTSNNPEIVKVNSDKSITAVKGGSARIKLTTTNGKYTYVLVAVKDDYNLTDSYYNNYYGDLTWENSEDLVNKLHAIISADVTPLKYDTPNWETNQVADQDLYDHSYVNCVYIDDPLLKTATNTGWQREHAFAASLMTGYSTGSAVKSLGRATDFHNLFAAGGGANGSRGNKNLGYATPESQEIEQKENCVFDKKKFEPADEDKGRLARALLYMSVMYNTKDSVDISETWTFKGDDIASHPGSATKSMHVLYNQQPLYLTKNNVDYSKISINEFMMPKASNSPIVEYYRSLVRAEKPSLETNDFDEFRLQAYEKYVEQSMPYSIGFINDIMDWSSFPVDLLEMQHNNSVYSYACTAGKGTQGNRNPFVDYPQLADYIYGELKDQPGSLKELMPSYLALEMNKDEIHHYFVDSESIPAFQSGTKPSAADFNIKAVKNNLSEINADTSGFVVEDYTFTDDDVLTGTEITITTDKNTLVVPVKVTSGSVITFDTCTWNYMASGDKPAEVYGDLTDGVYTPSLNGLDFVVTPKNKSISLGNRKADGAVRFGSNSVYCETLTFETKEVVNFSGKNKVNAVFFNVACGASKTFDYKIMVGNSVVDTGTCNGSFTIYGKAFDSVYEGKVTIEISKILNAYIDVKGIAINAIA